MLMDDICVYLTMEHFPAKWLPVGRRKSEHQDASHFAFI
jgi:hypothetical protein